MDKVNNVRKVMMIRGSGVEDLTLTQTGNHWTNLLDFSRDAGCWVRNVRLVEAGRFPIQGGTKNFEVRDCLVEGRTLSFRRWRRHRLPRLYRRAGQSDGERPLQASASCAKPAKRRFRKRDSQLRFRDSDFQFHRDPNWDNLLENCVIRSRGGNKSYGSYGSAMTATTDPITGDLGARNVIWNNDFPAALSTRGGTLCH
jgi:hypothetical protein